MPAIKLFLCLGAMGAVVASATQAFADDFSNVSGIARFERRTTVTPQICEGGRCAKPQTYWSLILDGGGVRYELNQTFDLGREAAPDAIELNSVTIRPGTRLIVEARVDVVNRSFSILSDVQKVQVAMDMHDGPYEDREEFDASNDFPFFGWTCRSLNEPHPIYVDVQQVARGSSYAMRVVTEGGADVPGFQTLARFDHVAMSMTQASIGFVGDVQQIHAELDIDQSQGRMGALASTLKMKGGAELPISRSIQMVCDQTR